MRRVGSVVVAVLFAAALLVGGWWAGQAALEPPSDPLAAPAPVSFEVVEGTVGRSLPLSATARWETVGLVRAPIDGVVTSIDFDPAVPVADGARIASVNLVPAFVATGAVPAFRGMGPDSRGADVAQLQAFLARVGHDPGPQDGVFAAATERAVRAWQAAVGAPVTGVVELGSIVFVPSLPARARAVVEVGVGVGAGEPLLELVGAAPEFDLALTDEQVTLIPPDAVVRVTGPEGEWEARAGGIERGEEGNPVLELIGIDGSSVCAEACAAVPLVGESSWVATVVVIAEVTGPLVPVGAIRTDPGGTRSVVTDTGEELVVEVLGSSDGQAVVDGVEIGTRVLLPAAASP